MIRAGLLRLRSKIFPAAIAESLHFLRVAIKGGAFILQDSSGHLTWTDEEDELIRLLCLEADEKGAVRKLIHGPLPPSNEKLRP